MDLKVLCYSLPWVGAEPAVVHGMKNLYDIITGCSRAHNGVFIVFIWDWARVFEF